MKPAFIEAIAKAAQAAHVFRDDLADVYKRTETVAEELVFIEMLKQINEINVKLVRLYAEAQKVNGITKFPDEYLALVEKVRAIDAKAAEYMVNDAPKLENFGFGARLGGIFVFSETPQGYDFWHEISKKLDK